MSDSGLIDFIDHKASVTSIDNKSNTLQLTLTESAECEGCAAARLCNPGGSSRTTLAVPVPDATIYHIGEQVTLRGTEQLHRKAILIATVIPSIALIAIMVIVYMLTASEGAAAFAGLGSMIVFFLLLYLCRNKLAHEFSFEVLSDNEVKR